MKEKIAALWDHMGKRTDISEGVRTVTAATAVRWFGWGFAESLIPIFIFTFGTGFAQAGLLKSGYEIALILVLPIVGTVADRVRASTLILIGLFIYLFVGASYLLAGITGIAFYVFAARFLNGVAYGFDSTARGAYIRRHSSHGKIATAFGYFDTVANFWWIVAALLGIVLVKFVPIATLLFMITPTAVVAGIIIWHFRKKEEPFSASAVVASGDRMILREIVGWSGALKWMAVFNFFISGAGAVVAFYLPIEAYRDGVPLSAIIIMGVIATVPLLFGWGFGALFDAKGGRIFVYGLLLFAAILFSLAYIDTYVWQVIAYFGVNLVLELLAVGSNELVTIHAAPEHFGRIGSIITSIGTIGTLAAPLAVGIMIDSYGVSSSYLTLGILLAILAIIFAYLNTRGFLKVKTVVEAEIV